MLNYYILKQQSLDIFHVIMTLQVNALFTIIQFNKRYNKKRINLKNHMKNIKTFERYSYEAD